MTTSALLPLEPLEPLELPEFAVMRFPGWIRIGPVLPSIGERIVDWVYRPIERVYGAVLKFVMRHRWIVVLAAVAAIASIGPLAKAVPKGFLPKNDEAQFEISVRTPEGTSLAATALSAERIAREVRGWPEVSTTQHN